MAREREGLRQLEGVLYRLGAGYCVPVGGLVLMYVVGPHSYGTKSVVKLRRGAEGNAPVYGIQLVLSPFFRL